jgi:hypothetical protein
MYYCKTSGRQIYRSWFPSRINGLMEPWVGLPIGILKAILTPESSIPPNMVANQVWSRWLGPVKTLFWMANAIAIGIILAKICR